MNEILNQYIELSKKIISNNEIMVIDKFGFINAFNRSKISEYKKQLPKYYKELQDLDNKYCNFFKTTGAINDLNMLNAQLVVISRAREMSTSALSNYEKAILNIEGSLNFLLTTIIAITVMVISIVGLTT